MIRFDPLPEMQLQAVAVDYNAESGEFILTIGDIPFAMSPDQIKSLVFALATGSLFAFIQLKEHYDNARTTAGPRAS